MERLPPKPHAICFDLFETLITEYDPNYVPTPSLAARLGVPPQAFAAAWRDLQLARMCGEMADFASVLTTICEQLGVTPHAPTLQLLYAERLAAKAKPFQQIPAAILDLLRTLRERWGLKLGLISNATAEEVSAWSACALAPWFDTVLFSYQVGLAKPDPAIYQLACDRLGVMPAHCWFIGDGGSDELQGAVRAGLTPCWATWFLAQWGPARLSAQPQMHPAGLLKVSTPADVVRMLSML